MIDASYAPQSVQTTANPQERPQASSRLIPITITIMIMKIGLGHKRSPP